MTAPALRPARSPLALVPNSGVAIEIQQHAQPGLWTASIRMPDGTRTPLHRPEDPLGEAHAQLAICAARDPRIIAIVGGGLGFLTEAAHERFPHARIVVMEPFPLLAQRAQARTPTLYESNRVRVVVGPGFDGSGELWRLFDVEDPDDPDPVLLLNPALQRTVPSAMTTAVLLVRRATGAARMNARARRDNAGRYVVNTLRNLPHIIKGVDPQRLAGQFGGVPAVLVAAGPSLDSNLETLRHLGERALIVATDTSWRPLVSAGVDPHLVVSLDPSPLNGRHLSGISPRRDTWLLAEGSVEPDALRPFAGRVGTFRVGMHHPWPWLTQLGVNRPLARVWGSVLTAVFDLSLGFGCDPLIFVGADLAFTGQRPYCRGTTFESHWARHVAAGTSLRRVWQHTIAARATLVEADVHGEPVPTAAHLVEFRNWLVAHAPRQAGRRVVNATGGGILLGPGIEQADLAATLEPYPDRGDTVRDTIRRLFGLRTVSIHLRPVMEALAAIEDVTATDRGDAAPSPVSEWVAFGRPSLTSDHIHAAATEGRAALERPWTNQIAPEEGTAPSLEPPALRLYEADRVARMRALLTSDISVLDGCTAQNISDTRRSPQTWASDVAQVLAVLLAMPRLTGDTLEPAVSGEAAHFVPLSRRFAWTATAAPWLAALEELLLEGHGTARALIPESFGGDFWSGSIEPVLEATEPVPEGPALDDEHRARIELSSLQLRVLAGTDERASLGEQRLARALLRSAAVPALHVQGPAPYHVELHSQDAPAPVPIRIDALMRALTGTIAWADAHRPAASPVRARVWPNLRAVVRERNADADPRLVFLGEDVDYVEPDVLTARGLPRGFSLYPVAHDRVVFVPSGATESLHITSEGVVESGSKWPVAITGEMPWGTESGALAWNSVDSTIALRSRAGAEPLVESVPFRPMRVALAPDGSAFWSALKGGVWAWLPGQSGRLIIDAPTWGRIFLDGDDLVLPPITIPDSEGRLNRRRLRHEWRCALGGPKLRRVEGAREGQCYGIATRGRWTARAYPFSDLIRLESADGDALGLACHMPTNIAWAGGSLVVGTGEGTVLLFRALIERLTALCPAQSASAG